MAYQKLQAGRALAIIPSDTVNIPNISAIAASGTAAAPSGDELVGVGTTFTKSVSVGDIIYAGTIAANVLAVVNDTTLTTSAGITNGLKYTIYSEANNPSNGCVLYCGGEGTISVVTSGGDTVEFTRVSAGQFIPVQVLRVNATVSVGTIASNIVALW